MCYRVKSSYTKLVTRGQKSYFINLRWPTASKINPVTKPWIHFPAHCGPREPGKHTYPSDNLCFHDVHKVGKNECAENSTEFQHFVHVANRATTPVYTIYRYSPVVYLRNVLNTTYTGCKNIVNKYFVGHVLTTEGMKKRLNPIKMRLFSYKWLMSVHGLRVSLLWHIFHFVSTPDFLLLLVAAALSLL